MNLRVRENPWRLMLAVNVAVVIGVFLYKITPRALRPLHPSAGRLSFRLHQARADRRDRVAVLREGTGVAGVRARRRRLADHARLCSSNCSGEPSASTTQHLPLFVFMAGSPFFLKNFMHTLGHFDIYGCAFAIGLLLVPARSVAFVLLAALASMILDSDPSHSSLDVCADHRGHRGAALLSGAGLQPAECRWSESPPIAAIGVLFLAAQFCGTMAVPQDEFVRYLQSRMADPSRTESAEFQLTSGISRCRRKSTIPGSACPPTCWAFRCSRC